MSKILVIADTTIFPEGDMMAQDYYITLIGS